MRVDVVKKWTRRLRAGLQTENSMAVLAASRLTGITEERKEHDGAGMEGVVKEKWREGQAKKPAPLLLADFVMSDGGSSCRLSTIGWWPRFGFSHACERR